MAKARWRRFPAESTVRVARKHSEGLVNPTDREGPDGPSVPSERVAREQESESLAQMARTRLNVRTIHWSEPALAPHRVHPGISWDATS